MAMKNLTITSQDSGKKNYEVLFLQEFSELETALNEFTKGRKTFFITDENVSNKLLKKYNFTADLILPAGEKEKNWATVEKILDKAFELKLDRNSIFVAIGGGVIGDLVGFSASIFMRGVDVVQIPTSLLSMVDSSVGGKTGFNNKFGKNLVGSFHAPSMVLTCRACLETLPPEEITNGLAEMIKHAIITDKDHFKSLEEFSRENFSLQNIFNLLPVSVGIKAGIVAQDFKEKGERMKLNLGHTFGHAIEKLSNLKIPHGQAVAIGIIMAGEYAIKENLLSDKDFQEIKDLIIACKLSTTCDFSYEEIWQTIAFDKKKNNDEITLILPTKIGEVVLKTVKL